MKRSLRALNIEIFQALLQMKGYAEDDNEKKLID